MPLNIAVVYYSATGNVHALASAHPSGAGQAGEVALAAARAQGRRPARIGSALAAAREAA
jgi:hypothetical protein